MSKSSEAVKRWRKNTKDRIVESMGGKCQVCGYDKCHSALALHHLDPTEKEFSLGSIRSTPRSWHKIVEELRKCILVCHNCHSEIHDGVTELPETYSGFDERFSDYTVASRGLETNECPICKKQKPVANRYCSLECSGKSKYRFDWSSIDLRELLKEKTFRAIAEEFNVSDAAVHKRAKKLGLK